MMSEMEANKYKKFIASKKQSTESQNDTTGGNKKFLDFYNPTKELIGKEKCFCRVLPNKNSGYYFFYEFLKHTFKVGNVYKTAICTNSLNPITGNPISTSCKFCDFLNENKSQIDPNAVKSLKAKEAQVMLVYNYVTDSVQKYETNYYGFMDITTLLSKLIEEGVSIDEEGFDLIFAKDSNGYTKAVEAHAPKISLEDLFKKSANVKDLPDIYDECVPKITPKWQATIDAVFEYGLKAFAPTFASNNTASPEIKNQAQPRKTNSNASEYDPNADDSSESITESNDVETKITRSQVNVDSSDSSKEDMILDITNFVESLKQNQ